MSVPRFIVASPGHGSIYDNEALALHRHQLLRFIAMGTRRGVNRLPAEMTRLKPAFGLATYLASRSMSTFAAESFRFRLHPWFDHWVRKQLRPGDHLIATYGTANASFKQVRAQGGKTFVDAGNSHPENFWTILSEEARRWNSPYPPVARHHYERSLAMMADVDYVLSASNFVSKSYLERGFKPEQILPHSRAIDLSAFKRAPEARPKNRPLTLITTGTLCLRKGSPYLFEAFRLVQKKLPGTRFVLRNILSNDFKQLLPRYRDLPITWLETMPHAQLAARLREADIFILPSLEDGLALTVVEALACGLPVITTLNTGASDLIVPGRNGEIVPIRDPAAIAEAVFKWADPILSSGTSPKIDFDASRLTFDAFEKEFIGQLTALGLVPKASA
jgi:glycosyltransferase involved in cell wall biosynthesis